MGVDGHKLSPKTFSIDPRIEMLLTRGCLPEDSVTFVASHYTFPPKRIMNVRELMDFQRAQIPPSANDTFSKLRDSVADDSPMSLEVIRESDEEFESPRESLDHVIPLENMEYDRVISKKSIDQHRLASVKDIFHS
ncbi:hypothetical protein GEMRC1_003607 [Eukaryota sp. GEM-RC1]